MHKNFGEIVEKLVKDGFESPFTVAAVSNNGPVKVYRYSQSDTGWDATLLAEHPEGSELYVPTNQLWVDSFGRATRVYLQEDGPPKFF